MEFKKYRLGEIATFSQGKQVDVKEQYATKEKDMKKFTRIIDYTNASEPVRYVENYGDRYFASENDLVMIRYGSQTAGMAVMGKNGIIANNLFKINLNNDIVLNKYMYYYLSQKEIFNYLRSSQSSSTMPAISFSIMNSLEIDIPSISYQKKSINILQKIDRKIELNNQINDNLQKFIRDFYKETFKNEQKKKKIKEVVEFSQGVQVPIENQSEKYENGFIRFIRIVDLTQGGKNNIRYIENKDRGMVNYDDVFMIRYGSPGILGWNYKGIIANNLFKINPKNDETTKNYLYCYFNDEEIQTYIKQNATSSTMPAINFSLLYDRLIAIPNKEKLLEFDRVIEITRLKLLELSEENERLANLREILLPKLMNGEIDLDKIEV